jgi:hypothetical protein
MLVRKFEERLPTLVVLLEQKLNELPIDRLTANKIHRCGLNVRAIFQAHAEPPM